MANFMFETTVTNAPYNQTQNVPGKYGMGTGASFVPAECPAGTLCIQNGLIPSEGYEEFNILNGNTWYFNNATSGIVTGATGDHTGIYACNTYNVNKVTSGELSYNLGANTLGLSIPSGDRGDFTELIVGEQYTFGKDNFSAAVGTNTFATIAAGKWVPAAAAPTTGAVYAQIMRTKPINEGASFWGDGYVLKIMRSVAAG